MELRDYTVAIRLQDGKAFACWDGLRKFGLDREKFREYEIVRADDGNVAMKRAEILHSLSIRWR